MPRKQADRTIYCCHCWVFCVTRPVNGIWLAYNKDGSLHRCPSWERQLRRAGL